MVEDSQKLLLVLTLIRLNRGVFGWLEYNTIQRVVFQIALCH